MTSFVISFPRVILAEAITHRRNSDSWGEDVAFCERTTTRDISKNSASSRAIPFERMVDKVLQSTYMPEWTLNQKGMQGGYLDDETKIKEANNIWLTTRDFCIESARELASLGIHKQDSNRLIEGWSFVTQIVTSSRWDNFFALRCHPAAHPALRRIARMMFLARRKSVPTPMEFGQWHLPFVPVEEQSAFIWDTISPMPDLLKFSAARCGWLSYENHDRDGSPEAMLRTFDRFFSEMPIHGSVMEHQATPVLYEVGSFHPYDAHSSLQSNLVGWVQARKLLPHEEVTKYEPSEEEIASWGIEG